ncbi:MAG: hypothetical protein WC860_02480 [Candidatus Margulisiibacteriota bacterium]
MLKSKKNIFVILFLIGIIISPAFSHAADLSPADYKNLTKQKVFEHIIYEFYANNTHGPEGVLGYQVDSFFNKNLYLAISICGIVSGKQGGFGIVSGGLGLRYNLLNNLDFDSKFLVGSGGGGKVEGGGGFMFELLTGLSWQLIKNIYLDGKIGYLKFPTGKLETMTYTLGVSWFYEKIIL